MPALRALMKIAAHRLTIAPARHLVAESPEPDRPPIARTDRKRWTSPELPARMMHSVSRACSWQIDARAHTASVSGWGKGRTRRESGTPGRKRQFIVQKMRRNWYRADNSAGSDRVSTRSPSGHTQGIPRRVRVTAPRPLAPSHSVGVSSAMTRWQTFPRSRSPAPSDHAATIPREGTRT
jgi:hypothetical protein